MEENNNDNNNLSENYTFEFSDDNFKLQSLKEDDSVYEYKVLPPTSNPAPSGSPPQSLTRDEQSPSLRRPPRSNRQPQQPSFDMSELRANALRQSRRYSQSSSPNTFRRYKEPNTGELIDDVQYADPSNTREVASAQLELINRYHHNVLEQAQQSFHWALIAAGIGLIFFVAAVSLLILKLPESTSIISVISGSLIELISGLNFYLYGRTSRQLLSFHNSLIRTHHFLLADSLCEKFTDNKIKDTTRAELVRNLIVDNPHFIEELPNSNLTSPIKPY